MGIFLTIILLSAIVALLGINRKFGFWGYFFASILLTPLLGLCLVVASDRRHPKNKEDAESRWPSFRLGNDSKRQG